MRTPFRLRSLVPSKFRKMESSDNIAFASPIVGISSPCLRAFPVAPRPATRHYTASGHGRPRMSGQTRRKFVTLAASSAATAALSALVGARVAQAARPEGVNRPELLPAQYTTVIDLERFLASGEVRRLRDRIDDVEKRTGFKIRLLTQRYPQTPGLAIRDYWHVDDDTVVIVADYFGGSGQLLKFNVGAGVDRLLPPRYWSILSANYGNKFYVEKNGEALSIINAVDSIRSCLLRGGCAAPPPDLDSVRI